MLEYYLPKAAYFHMPLKHKAAMQYYDKGITVLIWQTEILLENLIVYFLHLHHGFMYGGCNINHLLQRYSYGSLRITWKIFTTPVPLQCNFSHVLKIHWEELIKCVDLTSTCCPFVGILKSTFFPILTRTGIFFSNWGRIHE